jgi:hypothetical protein
MAPCHACLDAVPACSHTSILKWEFLHRLQAKLFDGSLKITHSRHGGSCLLLLISNFTPVMFLCLCLQKLALTSPTSGGRSVDIVYSRTQVTEFSVCYDIRKGQSEIEQ